jgi:hypothetical protein
VRLRFVESLEGSIFSESTKMVLGFIDLGPGVVVRRSWEQLILVGTYQHCFDGSTLTSEDACRCSPRAGVWESW